MDQIFKSLEEAVSGMFQNESSGHDINHLKRVHNIALHIQGIEGGDRLVIGAAALLHDVHRLLEKESGIFCPPKDSLPKVAEILHDVAFPEDKIAPVLHAIEFHEEYGFSETSKTATDIETLILQDADNLDAIGAVGIGRTFSFSGTYGIPMWVPEIPFDRTTYNEAVRDPSTLHHFYSKLLKLGDHMNTETGKTMAKDRHEFMETFVAQFFAEWKGEK